MASVDWQRQTLQKVGSLKKHNGNEERLEYNHSNPDIDKSRTNQNYCIGCSDYNESADAAAKRVHEIDEKYPPMRNGKVVKPRKDRTECISLEVKCPQEIYDRGQQREYFEKWHKLAQDFFGVDDVHGTCVHLDEIHPYIDKDGNEKMSLAHATTLVSAFAKWTDKKGNIHRGISASKLENPTNLITLNKLMCDMVRREFGVEYNTGEQAQHDKTEVLKAKSELAKLQREKSDIEEVIAEIPNLIKQQFGKDLDKLNEIKEEIDIKTVELTNIPPRPQLPPPLPPDEPRPAREHRPYTREEEKELTKAQKQYDKDHSKGGERWTQEQQYEAAKQQALKSQADYDELYQPIAAAKNVIAKYQAKAHELAARERQIQQAQQQNQAELERGRAENEKAKRALAKREQDMDIEVERRTQERLALTDKYQQLMQTSTEWDKRMATLYKGADKQNEKAFKDKVSQKKGDFER